MNKRIAAVAIGLIAAAHAAMRGAGAAGRGHQRADTRRRDERSQVMRTLHFLADVYARA
jgi:hypothetical protein